MTKLDYVILVISILPLILLLNKRPWKWKIGVYLGYYLMLILASNIIYFSGGNALFIYLSYGLITSLTVIIIPLLILSVCVYYFVKK